MYNVRKCPKCGGNVPEGNEVCNNCGHKMRFFGGSSVIVTGSKNSNTIPGGNPFETKKSNNSGCLAVILILFFFGLPFFSVFYELFQEFSVDINEDDYDIEENKCTKSCGDSAYKEYNNYCFCENGNIYDENGYVEHYYTGVPILDNNAKCKIYCDDLGATFGNDMCSCPNGKNFNIEGEEIVVKDEIEDDIISLRSVSEWYSEVKSGKAVVTVLCESDNTNCSSYKAMVNDFAKGKEDKFTLFYFDLDKLEENDKNTLVNTYTFRYNEDLRFIPYTFIVNNDEFVTDTTSYFSTSSLETLLKIYDIIEE